LVFLWKFQLAQRKKLLRNGKLFLFFGWFELFRSSKILEKLIISELEYWAQQHKNTQVYAHRLGTNSKTLKNPLATLFESVTFVSE
jgi:hypothetical protein